MVIDHALVGVLRGELQLGRNTLLSVVKLVALAAVAELPIANRPLALYATYLVGTVVSFVVLFRLADFGKLPWAAFKPDRTLLRRLGRSALEHHALNLALQIPTLVLPLMVTVMLSATMNAYFYVASMFAGFVYIVPVALSTTLYAVSAHEPATLTSKTRLTVGMSMLGVLGASLFLVVAAPILLPMFGRGYADEVDWLLRVMLLAAVPVAIKTHYVAISQVRRQVRRAALVTTFASSLELVLGALGAIVGGLHGLAVGVVLAQFLEAVAMAPVVFHVVVPGATATAAAREATTTVMH
jgi:O-antigen/teichoic acid export membrane protein